MKLFLSHRKTLHILFVEENILHDFL